MKRLLAALLAAVLCVTLSAPALAAQSVTAHTTLAGSTQAQRTNIEIAASRIDGFVVPSGARFSFNDTVGPRTKAYGFQTAVNGRGVKVTGGGVAQVASTLYLALCELGDDIWFDEKKTYGDKFTGGYVDSGADAILVDYSSGVDFAFTNYGAEMCIGMWATDNNLYCTLTVGGEAQEESFLEWIPSTPTQNSFAPLSGASIDISGASDALRNNILLAASSINDTVLASGDLFSFNDSVGPRIEKYGYETAVNGRGVKVTGGGVAQVASAIWLAVKGLDCVAIVEKSTYGSRYNQSYVFSSNDAILTDYADGTDFSFRNTGAAPITIATYISGDVLFCDIYQN